MDFSKNNPRKLVFARLIPAVLIPLIDFNYLVRLPPRLNILSLNFGQVVGYS